MKCPRCGQELSTGQRACSRCGLVVLESSSEGWPVEILQTRQEGSPARQRVSSHQNLTNMNEASVQSASLSLKPQDQQNSQRPPLRATRFTTPLPQNEPQGRAISQPVVEAPTLTPTQPPLEAAGASADAFVPGTLLKGGRYRITGRHNYQRWASNIYETHWLAQDLIQGEANVLVCEMGLSEIKIAARQASLRTAMRALFSAGTHHSRIPELTNVFRESGRDFFVFAAIDGETLLQKMQQAGQKLQEQEVIQCCLQLIEILETTSRQEPPLLHGLINPENILLARDGQWSLTDFSVVLASGANHYPGGIDPALLSPFASPDLAEGTLDTRSDLYSLLATAYYAVTGQFPRESSGQAFKPQQLSAFVSPSFAAILTKGLNPLATQHYQQASALRRDLLSLHPEMNKPASMNGFEQGSGRALRGSEQRQYSSAPLQPRSGQEQYGNTLPQPGSRQGQYGNMPPQPGNGQGQYNSMPLQMNGQPQVSNSLPSPSQQERFSNGLAQRGGNGSVGMYGQEGQNVAAVQRMPQERPLSSPGINGRAFDPVAQALSSLNLPGEAEEPAKDLLPRPEELPPIPQGNDTLAATLWMVGILICLLIPIIMQ